MPNDHLLAPLAQPQDVVAGRIARATDLTALPGNINAALAKPQVSVMDLRVPDAETPIFIYGGGAGFADVFSAPMRLISPSTVAAVFSAKITIRAEVLAVAGTLKATLASGPVAIVALPVAGVDDVSVTVGPIAAPFDDLDLALSVDAAGTINGFGAAVDIVSLADPIPGPDFGDPGGPGVVFGDAVAIDVAAVDDDGPLDAALLTEARNGVAHIYARPRPIYARVGFSVGMAGQEHLGSHRHRAAFAPSVGAAAVPTVWAYVHNTTDAERDAFIYWGPEQGWPARSTLVAIPANTKTWARFDLPVREGRDLQAFNWPMTEIGYASTPEMEFLSVAGGVA